MHMVIKGDRRAHLHPQSRKERHHQRSFRPTRLSSYSRWLIILLEPRYWRGCLCTTETALFVLSENIQELLEHKEMAIYVFLDIEEPFDNTYHEAMKRTVRNKGINRTTSRWMYQMLATKTAETNVGKSNIQINTNLRYPRGGVLSPSMWSLVVDELLRVLTGNGVTCLGYADNIVIRTKGKLEGTFCNLVEKELKTTKRWSLIQWD